MKSVIPILSIFDERKAKEFYLDYLGFRLEWEHRFEPEYPLYFQISNQAVQIHLSSITEIARRGQPSEFSAKIFKIIIVYSNLKNILSQIQELKRIHGTHMN